MPVQFVTKGSPVEGWRSVDGLAEVMFVSFILKREDHANEIEVFRGLSGGVCERRVSV
jgi:hypothetical protein